MRLWHKDLIPVLPGNQLRGQWRECCLIAKVLHDGNLNHLLVNKVKDYPLYQFCDYCCMVWEELLNRGVKADANKAMQYFPGNYLSAPSLYILFEGWHNDRYLRQCLYNLQEKYDCGGIPAEQWTRIVEKFPWIEEDGR